MGGDSADIPDLISIKELVAVTGISRDTIHYYLKEKLLPPPLKTSRTMALYNNAHIKILGIIRDLRQKEGLSIAQVRSELESRFKGGWREAEALRDIHAAKTNKGLKGRRQKKRIIDKAVEFFGQKGYHRTHVSHITDALNISKGTFYLYFENKQHLLVAVFNEIIDAVTRTEEEIDNETNFFKRMRARAHAYLAFYEKYHKIFDIIRAESIGQEYQARVNIQTIYKKMLNPMYEDMKKAYEQGLITDTGLNPEVRVDMLLGAFDFMCFSFLSGYPHSLEDVLDVADSLFFH